MLFTTVRSSCALRRYDKLIDWLVRLTWQLFEALPRGSLQCPTLQVERMQYALICTSNWTDRLDHSYIFIQVTRTVIVGAWVCAGGAEVPGAGLATAPACGAGSCS